MQPKQSKQPRMNSLSKGWLLTKVSWRVLRLNKSLIMFPILNVLISGFLLVLFGVLGYFILYSTGGDVSSLSNQYNATDQLPGWFFLLLVLFLVPLFLIMNYFTACVTAGALQRFRGQNPTVKSSFQGANQISGKLVEFSFYQNGAIWVINAVSKTPLIGGYLEFLGELAFTVGSFFVLPIMVDGAGKIRPFDAIKQSTEIIKKVWGESVVIVLGMPFIAILVGIIYTVIWGVALVIFTPELQNVTNGHESFSAAIIIISLALGYGVIMVFYSALSSIVTAALYIYATESKAPIDFDTDLLTQAVRQKTSSDIF